MTTPADEATGTDEATRICAERLGRPPAAPSGHPFAVLLNCIDGRAQQPAAQWVQAELDVTYVDVVTEPGVDAVLARGSDSAVGALLNKVCVSRLAHGAVGVVIAGHHDCAANPGDENTHARDVASAVERVRNALPGVPVKGVYVDEEWTVRAVWDHWSGTE